MDENQDFWMNTISAVNEQNENQFASLEELILKK